MRLSSRGSCRRLDREVPAELRCTSSSITPPRTRRRRSSDGCSPTLGSCCTSPDQQPWLNLVERWFAELTNKKLQRGAHRSVRELNTDIRGWIKTWNENPRPFVWTKTADQILESIARYCTRINDSRHYALSGRHSLSPSPKSERASRRKQGRDGDPQSRRAAYAKPGQRRPRCAPTYPLERAIQIVWHRDRAGAGPPHDRNVADAIAS